MTQHVNASQQQRDTQAQNDLTSKVGVKLTRPEKSTGPWSAMKRLLRVG